MRRKQSAAWICLAGAFCVATALVGCNQKPGAEQKQLPGEPSILHLAQDPDDHPAKVLTELEPGPPSSSNIMLTQQTTDAAPPAAPKAAPAEDPLHPIYAKLEDLLKAREAGKTVDFQPVADLITKSMLAKFDIEQFQLAQDAGHVFEMVGANNAAKQIYTALKKAAEAGDPSQLTFVAKETAVMGLKRLNLLGSTPIIQGTVFGGEKFDWAKYKGKVVLIDFWATWCGPCLHELPNVKKAYELYHDRGFDVVGISLDEDKDALTEFLDKEKLPWQTLFDDDPAKHGFEGVKLARDFGIDAIPATFLVDQQGKIISVSARGEQLRSQLQNLLGDKK